MTCQTELAAYALIIIDALFWYGSFRYYRRVATELSQYAQPPIKSASLRAGVVSLTGFGLASAFVYACAYQSNYMSPYFVGEVSFLSFFIFVLSIISPIFDCVALLSFSVSSSGVTLTLENVGAFLVYASVLLVPSGYILYKTRKEIESRLEMAVGSPPKRIYDHYKRKGHGNPIAQGICGTIRGLVLFPVYVYQDLFKAPQGIVTFEDSKVVGAKTRGDSVAVIRSTRRVEFNVAEELEALDESTVGLSEAPICPKCKRPLTYLKDQEKFWCEKCKRARYTRSRA